MLHLPKRFFGFVSSEPPTVDELNAVERQLSPDLYTLFIGMAPEDQRHAIEVAARVADPNLAEPALLHDVGKTAAPLGALARSGATMAGMLGLPVSGSWKLYLEHGDIGATMLESAGAAPISIAFARFHPGPVPAGIVPEDWHALSRADDI